MFHSRGCGTFGPLTNNSITNIIYEDVKQLLLRRSHAFTTIRLDFFALISCGVFDAFCWTSLNHANKDLLTSHY